MKNILAIDTASKLMGVTLKTEKEKFSDFINDGFTHSENLLPMIDRLLKEANLVIKDLDLLICTRGPGSFTGLRIGMSTLKGISLGLHIPIVSVPTLDLYAFKNDDFDGTVLPILDARKKCFYTAIYKNGIKTTDNLDIPKDKIEEILISEDKVLLTGLDAEILFNALDDGKYTLDKNCVRNYSKELVELGIIQFNNIGADKPSQGPLYIRKSEAEIMLNKKAK